MIRGNSYIQRTEDSVAAMPLPQKTVLGPVLSPFDSSFHSSSSLIFVNLILGLYNTYINPMYVGNSS
ncbi:hypothetical protein D1609_15115 [Leptospira borgpetersenii serovar Hardjo-bovis]|nr:hypothetical protein B9T54_15005 [Leptospira borgpetersenii serovar Hardjo-bovis]AYR09569.1 hypothetical protein D1609_15115 [Leptospira borgpetersenii serovar Hardjo-bovis]TQE55038.1 hypothetical protein FFZ95_01435 [Leptospira borgpetersenii]TQE59285.1 hypothetical protein FFZ96_00750 [Leptospira borgpetersenii]